MRPCRTRKQSRKTQPFNFFFFTYDYSASGTKELQVYHGTRPSPKQTAFRMPELRLQGGDAIVHSCKAKKTALEMTMVSIRSQNGT
jgi:hypothetical protein